MISCASRSLRHRGLALSAAFLLLLTACGASEESPLATDDRAYIWHFQSFDLLDREGEAAGGGGYAAGFFSLDDQVCAIVNRYGASENNVLLVRCSADGDGVTAVPLEDPAAGVPGDGTVNIGSFCGGDGGIFYGLETISRWDETTGEEESSCFLLEFTADGAVAARHDLTDEAAQSANDSYYVESMSALGDGRLLFKDSTGLFAYDTRNEERWQVYASDGWFDASITVLSDGAVLVGTWGDEGYVLKELDVATGQFSEPVEVPADMNGAALYAGRSHDCYYYANRALWYYDRQGGKRGKVLDFVASDLLADDITGALELADGRLALITAMWGDSGQEPTLIVGAHVPPEEVKDKEEITISCVYVDRNVMRLAVAFNQESEDYRIRIADYSQYQSESDWTYPYTKLNTDIISGHIPDILILDEMMPLESYINKGILRDLTPLIEGDDALSKAVFLDNVFDAYRINGALYQLIPGFSVYTGVASTALLDGRTMLTMRDLADICAAQGIDVRDSFGAMTRDDLLNVLLYMQGAEFIDLETGRCAFDSPAFIELLELVKQFPTKLSDDAYTSLQTAYREGRAVLMLYGLDGFDGFAQLKYGRFGGDITMVGIPGSEGSGSVILPQMRIAITTSAEHPEAVWSFVRRLLLEDYQDALSWGFPVRMDSLQKKVEKAKERPYYIDETGAKVEYDESWWIGGQEVTIPPLGDEEAAQVTAFLAGCDRRGYSNNTVTNIITEEAAAFFEGQKTAEDVAKIIQSRAQIYVHENR